MAPIELRKLAGIPFSEIFGNEETVSIGKVEAFLDRLAGVAAEEARTSPNRLIKIVHGSQVIWMTQLQAAEFMEEDLNSRLQDDVEKALKGDLKFVRQELEILYAVLVYAFKQYKEQNEIAEKDISRIEPTLNRRKMEIQSAVSQTAEYEARITEKRRKNPLLNEYEELMGQFLNEKNKENSQNLVDLARKLMEYKKKYLLLARSLEPDVKAAYFQRLNLQKTKKKLLSAQSELCSCRSDVIEFEIKELQESLHDIHHTLERAQAESEQSVSLSMGRDSLFDIEGTKNRIMDKSNELSAVEMEKAAIQKQEAAVDMVIEHISTNILQETDEKVQIKQQNRPAIIPLSAPASDPSKESKKTKVSGMHFGHRSKD